MPKTMPRRRVGSASKTPTAQRKRRNRGSRKTAPSDELMDSYILALVSVLATAMAFMLSRKEWTRICLSTPASSWARA
jgi:hypothetical protein